MLLMNVVVAAMLSPSVALAPDTLQGRVTTVTGEALPNANVTITMGPDRVVKTSAVDSAGRWLIVFPEGTGDYLVYVAAENFVPTRRRVTRTADKRLFVIDLVLTPSPAKNLKPVVVRAAEPKPDRRVEREFGPGVGEDLRDADGVYGTLPPDQMGDPRNIAATTAGVMQLPNGDVIAFGLRGQDDITLGGLQFEGANIPRSAPTSVRVVSSTYDPALGGFGSVQTQIYLNSGGPFSSKNAHVAGNPAILDATPFGAPETGLQLSVGGDGPLSEGRNGYGYGLEIKFKHRDVNSLFSPGKQLGVAFPSDSVLRILQIANMRGIKTDAGIQSLSRNFGQISFLGTIGRQPFNYADYGSVRKVWTLTGFANIQRASAVDASPTAAPSRFGASESASGTIQGGYSAFVGKRDWLADLRSGLTVSHRRTVPYVTLPGVIIQGWGEDAITLGGNSRLAEMQKGLTWESLGELRLYPPGLAKHRVTLTMGSRFELQALQSNPQSVEFGYQTLGDFAKDEPSFFARTAGSQSATGVIWNSFLSLGDYWRPTRKLQFMYGIRMDGVTTTTAPQLNTSLLHELAVRNDVTPHLLAVSPRFGFTWTDRFSSGALSSQGRIGQLSTINARSIRGGVGIFRSSLPITTVLPALRTTGLTSDSQRSLCTGEAIPAQEWREWAAGEGVSLDCNANVSNANAVYSAPSTFSIDRYYVAPYNWRANVAWSSMRWNTFYTVEGAASLGLSQPSLLDANFAGVSHFSTSTEKRPVFVSAEQIQPSTGILLPVSSRVSQAFANVLVRGSNSKTSSQRLTLSVRPEFPKLGSWFLAGSYTLANTRQQSSGFEATTFENPRVRSWARGDFDARHQYMLQGGVVFKGITVTAFGRLTSGFPFTPIVGSDVNGDGFANDRAFIFPITSGLIDPEFAEQWNNLMRTLPVHARMCVERAIGTVVDRNACDGEWMATANIRGNVPGTFLGLSKRVNVAINVDNPLAGVDRLVNGEHLKGWGSRAIPDEVLYEVNGFDPTTQRFRYSVNPRFGSPRHSSGFVRSPFRFTVDVSFDLGPSFGAQQLEQWFGKGRKGRSGQRLSKTDLELRYRCNVPDPYRLILLQSDSLFLSSTQSEQIRDAQVAYRTTADSAWSALATYMASIGDQYDVSKVYERQQAATSAVWEITRIDAQKRLAPILSPLQIRLAPANIRLLLSSSTPIKVRIFTAGRCD